MKIAVGSDHAGFEFPEPFYKPEIVQFIQSLGHEVVDCGPDSPDPVDYPDYGEKVAQTILNVDADRGVLLCGTGIGISIAANRHKGIRAAVCVNPEMAQLSREHNDANIICLGKRLLNLDECKQLIQIWIETAFSGQERHQRRVDKLC